MGDYYRPTYASQVFMGFTPANPISFNIEFSMLSDLRDKPFDEKTTSDPWEYLARFHETTPMCQPEDIIEDRVKLKLFNFSLVGRAKDWLLCLPNGVIRTWRDLEDKFLERLFTIAQFTEMKAKITHFEQQDIESLYNSWERFKLLLHICPNHSMNNIEQMHNFVKGLQTQVRMFLYAPVRGTIRKLTESRVKELIEKMSLNEYNFLNTKGFNRVETKNIYHSELTLV